MNKHLQAANDAAQSKNWKKGFESLESAETANKDNIANVEAEIAQLRCRGMAETKQHAKIATCDT